MIWHISQFPELAHLGPAERKAVLRVLPSGIHLRYAASALVLALITTVAVSSIIQTYLRGRPGEIVAFLTYAFFAMDFYLLSLRSLRFSTRREIRRLLAGVRATTHDNCPECGALT